jgi:hypothetical protein
MWLTQLSWCPGCTSLPCGCQCTVPAYAVARRHGLPHSHHRLHVCQLGNYMLSK